MMFYWSDDFTPVSPAHLPSKGVDSNLTCCTVFLTFYADLGPRAMLGPELWTAGVGPSGLVNLK